MSEEPARLDRYRQQVAFPQWGPDAQRRLEAARVLIVGCGALGTAQANLLVRAGVGRVVIADRDFVDLSNLQRQTLFDETDVANVLPKAVAAGRHLSLINSHVDVQPMVVDVTWENVRGLVAQADLVLDGTDNFETRFLLNEACCQADKPWVHGGCLGASGQSMTIIPGRSACLACLMPEGPPAAGSLPTCDSGGVLGTIIQIIASLQVSEGLKILSGQHDQVSRELTFIDSWSLRFRSISLRRLAQQGCDVCRGGRYRWLTGAHLTQAQVLCGRNSVQLKVPLPEDWDLDRLAQKLADHGEVRRNPYLLRFSGGETTLTLFPDGRVIVSGTADPGVAKAHLSRFIGM
jgi:adenylyltransferase/sulfurtransferase